MLHALQVDQANVVCAGLRLADEEMAAIQVAMVEALPVEASGDVGHLRQQPVEFSTAGLPDREGMIQAGESLPQKMIELHVAGQLFGQDERFERSARAEPLAKGNDWHGLDAGIGQAGHVFGLDPPGRGGRRAAELGADPVGSERT